MKKILFLQVVLILVLIISCTEKPQAGLQPASPESVNVSSEQSSGTDYKSAPATASSTKSNPRQL